MTSTMGVCKFCGGSPIEAFGICASCSSQIRKDERYMKRERKRPTIKKVSPKRKKENKTYTQLRKEYLAKHTICRAALPGCMLTSVDVHHLSGRGSKLNAVDTFMAVCRNCHNILHNKLSAQVRREKGLLK